MKGTVSTLLSISFLFVGSLSGLANEEGVMAVSFDTGVGSSLTDGTSKTEAYDVAIRLKSHDLVGKRIVGISVPLVSANGIGDFSGWLSSALTLDEDNINVPDITSVTATPVDGWNEIMFDTPYEITSKGVYVGYSFNITQLNNNNMTPVCLTSMVSSDGFFMHTSRTRKYREWLQVNNGTDASGSLQMRVLVEGMPGDAASLELYHIVNVLSGDVAEVPATLTCHGYNGIKSIEYEYSIGDITGTNTLTLEEPVEPVYNMTADLSLPLCKVIQNGEFETVVKLTKVNGQPNADPVDEMLTTVYVSDFVPTYRPLVEEYTGTWCGNCPRGIASMELMKERHGDDFISIAYHNGDPMETVTSFPSEIRGYPDCWISRIKSTDPFFGDKLDGFHFEDEWLAISKQPTSVAVDVTTSWADEAQEIMNAKVTVISQQKYDDNALAVAMVLVGDDLHDSSWYQINYYAGKSATCAPELLEFANSSARIQGLHYNDVALITYNLTGAGKNLPAEVNPMDVNVVENNFTLADAVSTDGGYLVQDKSKLRVIAMVIDRNSGEVLNSNQSSYLETTGVESLSSDDAEVISVKYYDLTGREIISDYKGICIQRTQHNDGKLVSRKIVL